MISQLSGMCAWEPTFKVKNTVTDP